MPIHKIIRKKKYQIGIWNITEKTSQLLRLSKMESIPKFKTEKRIKEFLSCRLLIHELRPQMLINYNKYGAPEANTNEFVSISHSKNMSAVILSKNKVGLDIEKISEKALKLSSKFIKQNTHIPLSKDKATLIWCCKEAIYKWHQKGNINFSNDIVISPFTIKREGILIAKFKQRKLTLYYKKIKTHFLVYVCK